jgi:hypothetical protein
MKEIEMHIDKQFLVKRKACQRQVDLFVEAFGEEASVEVTTENLKKAFAVGLDVRWLTGQFTELKPLLTGKFESSKIVIYFQDGLSHREDGPAIQWKDGNGKFWYRHGKSHRTDGPASMTPWGDSWWVNGVKQLAPADRT